MSQLLFHSGIYTNSQQGDKIKNKLVTEFLQYENATYYWEVIFLYSTYQWNTCFLSLQILVKQNQQYCFVKLLNLNNHLRLEMLTIISLFM